MLRAILHVQAKSNDDLEGDTVATIVVKTETHEKIKGDKNNNSWWSGKSCPVKWGRRSQQQSGRHKLQQLVGGKMFLCTGLGVWQWWFVADWGGHNPGLWNQGGHHWAQEVPETFQFDSSTNQFIPIEKRKKNRMIADYELEQVNYTILLRSLVNSGLSAPTCQGCGVWWYRDDCSQQTRRAWLFSDKLREWYYLVVMYKIVIRT